MIESAEAKDREQPQIIFGLQEAFASRDEELTRAYQEEVAELKQELWRTNCERLAEQDAIITAHEESAALRKQIRELQAWASQERISATHDEGTSRPSVRLGGGHSEATDSSPTDTS